MVSSCNSKEIIYNSLSQLFFFFLQMILVSFLYNFLNHLPCNFSPADLLSMYHWHICASYTHKIFLSISQETIFILLGKCNL